MSDPQAGYLSGSLLEAGSDTTSSILIGFVQAMMMFPEIQKRAKEEIGRVVGPDRLPTMDDESKMQYIRGCVKESIRWMPTTIMAAPHGVLQDDTYMGYTIPAGATIIINVWYVPSYNFRYHTNNSRAIHMDPIRNPSPRDFNPERFSNDFRTEFEAATSGDPSKRNNFIFGAGRRLCQGMHIAERSLFLAISRMLWAFDFNRPIDSTTGKEKPLPDIDDLVGGITVQPAPFEVVITPRSEKKEQMIREIWQDCEDMLLDNQTKQWKKIPEGMAFSTWMPEKVDL